MAKTDSAEKLGKAIDLTADGRGELKAPPAIPEFLPEIINCAEETDDLLRNLAERTGVALVAFIAPRIPVRISPTREARATITVLEEFGMEALVNKLEAEGVKKAYFLVNSPGGAMDSSYKIALAIRNCLDEITTFVPHVAASGGTLLSLVGNEIVMGPMSHITPLDTQVRAEQGWLSAASANRFYQRARRWFETQTPEEAPYPQRALTEKLDPYIMEEWNGILAAMTDYVREILELSGYEDAEKIAGTLVQGYSTHDYVINRQKAEAIGLNVKTASARPEEWNLMKYWLGKYLVEKEMVHWIRFVIPGSGAAASGNSGKG